jgi:tRNA A37 methylthiotransferase MiaB
VDVVFLNTCGFISSGREEAIEVIKELTKAGKIIYVLGCAIQYYKNIDKNIQNPLEGKNIHLLSRNDFDNITLDQLAAGYDSTSF